MRTLTRWLAVFLIFAVAGMALPPEVCARETIPAVPISGGALTDLSDGEAPLTITPKVGEVVLAPGGSVVVDLTMVYAKGYHGYPDEAQTLGPATPSVFSFQGPQGVILERMVWPKPVIHKSILGDDEAVFQGQVVMQVVLHAAADAKSGEGTLHYQGQACDEGSCVLQALDIPLKIKIDASQAIEPVQAAPQPAASSPHFSEPVDLGQWFGHQIKLDPSTGGGLVAMLLVAMLGGFILNFMPCVLPIIPLKIMGLANSAGSRRRCIFLGAMMSLGVVALWAVTGGALAAFSSVGGTSKIFTIPWVNLALGIFIVAMAFSTCGLFAIRLPQFIYAVNAKHDSVFGSFVFGVMTGIFALPCTGPFMATVSAAALKSQNLIFILGIFTAIGIGMALPYLVLAANPQWASKLPRSGPASDLMKQVLGWLMLAGGSYFIQCAVMQWINPEGHLVKRMGVIIVLAVAGVAGLLLVWGCVKLLRQGAKRWGPTAFIILGLGFVGIVAQQIHSEVTSLPFPFLKFTTKEALPLGKGKIVVVDFRTIVCPNCDWNEKTVFNTRAGKQLLGAEDVLAYQANLDDDQGTQTPRSDYLLELSGTIAVPYLVIYDANGNLSAKLPSTLTSSTFADAMANARAASHFNTPPAASPSP